MAENRDTFRQKTHSMSKDSLQNTFGYVRGQQRSVLTEIDSNNVRTPLDKSKNGESINMPILIDSGTTAKNVGDSIIGSILKRVKRPFIVDDMVNKHGTPMKGSDKSNNTPQGSIKKVKFAKENNVVECEQEETVFKDGAIDNNGVNSRKFLKDSLEKNSKSSHLFDNPSLSKNVAAYSGVNVITATKIEQQELQIVKHNKVDNTGPVEALPRTEKVRRRNRRDFEHWLLVRFQPKVLSDTVRILSANQRNWVKNTGFHSILSFRMNQYPQALSYNIAKTFQTAPTGLNFGGRFVGITDDDVNEILGLPKGGNNINIVRSTHVEDMWREQFKHLGRDGWKITANMVYDAIRKSTEADRLFKLNFLVLLHNIVIEGPSNPYVRQTILGFAGDIDTCYKYNWCKLLVSQLKIASVSWNESPDTKFYTGSVPLLVYIYMDRVVNGKRQVRRKKPTFIGWSDTIILDRQISDLTSNLFFRGKIALPIRHKDEDDESSYEDQTWNTLDNTFSDDDEVQGDYNEKLTDLMGKEMCMQHDVAHDENIIYSEQISKGPKIITNDYDAVGMEFPTNMGTPSTLLNEEVPTYVIDKLKANLESYEDIQKKCMMYLLSARDLFRKNELVGSLQDKFLLLVDKANEFIKHDISQESNISQGTRVDVGLGHIQSQQIFLDPGQLKHVANNKNIGQKNDLDDDLCFSSQDWLIIDSLSEPTKSYNVQPDDIFNNMESQSKFISLNSEKNKLQFTTPADDNVFKVHLDACIPNFNILLEEDAILNREKSFAPKMNQEMNLIEGTRPKRGRKVADIHKSPYFDRLTNIYGKSFRKEETDLWDWLHSNDQYPNRILFKWGKVMCYKVDFQSMKDGEMIMTSVMDVWCCYLNSLEELRAPASPYRIFCYNETTVGTLNASDEETINVKYMVFESNMDHVFESNGTTLSEVDMVFFPIHRVNHYYVVCYNLKIPSIEILDNRASERNIQNLYGHQLVVLHKHFTEYMKRKNFAKVNTFQNMEPQRLKMRWQTKNNVVDCGIYAMRHMETYFGGGSRNWDSKIQVESYTQKKQISRLRLLYTFRVLTSHLNCLYEMIADEIKDPTLLPDEKVLNEAYEHLNK